MTEQGDAEVPAANAGASPNPADGYEEYYVPALFEPWTQELLARAVPQPGERVLDVACGTGIVARRVAPLVGADSTVVGLDINPNMLVVARSAAAAEGVEIEWREGNAEELPFADACFDLVLCQHGLPIVRDRAAALHEMRRVLRPAGRAVIAVWRGLEHNPVSALLDAAMERHTGRPTMAVPHSLGNPEELLYLLNGAGFGDVTLDVVGMTARYPEPERYVQLTVMALEAAFPGFTEMNETQRAAFVQAVIRDVADALEPHIEGSEVVEPTSGHLVVARV